MSPKISIAKFNETAGSNIYLHLPCQFRICSFKSVLMFELLLKSATQHNVPRRESLTSRTRVLKTQMNFQMILKYHQVSKLISKHQSGQKDESLAFCLPWDLELKFHYLYQFLRCPHSFCHYLRYIIAQQVDGESIWNRIRTEFNVFIVLILIQSRNSLFESTKLT